MAVFQDDVIIGGSSRDEHMKIVKLVLQRLNDVGFTVKNEKCEFLKSSIKYLGYCIDKMDVIQIKIKSKQFSKLPHQQM